MDLVEAEEQYLLGVRYHTGIGVVADSAQAVQWFRCSAEQGHASAQNTLGHCYLTGRGVAKDPMAAVEWFRRAAEQGHAGGQYNLAFCYDHGLGVVEDPARAFAWAWQAAEQGRADAALGLGNAYRFGRGVAKDLQLALYWMERAQAKLPRARRQARLLRWAIHPILRYLHRAMWVAGLAFLAYHAATVPFSIHWKPIALFVGILFAASLSAVVLSSLLGSDIFERDANEHGFMVRRARYVIGIGLQVASEDGLFLVPLLYLGITVTSATIAGTAFGLAHYPQFLLPTCVPKGFAYIAVALFVLPSGIWNVIVGHVIVDAIVFAAQPWFRRRRVASRRV